MNFSYSKILFFLFSIFFMLYSSACSHLFFYSFADKNHYGRLHLKKMKFKNAKRDLQMDTSCVFMHIDTLKYVEGQPIFLGAFRFFDKGRYVYFGYYPLQSSFLDSCTIFKFNTTETASYIGYYKSKKNKLYIEYPNKLFRRRGYRNVDVYILHNNYILESVTKVASDYGAKYKKYLLETDNHTVPDW